MYQWNVSFAERAELMGYLHSDSHMELALCSCRRVSSYHRSRFSFINHVVCHDADSGYLPGSVQIILYCTLSYTKQIDKLRSNFIVGHVHGEQIGNKKLPVILLKSVSLSHKHEKSTLISSMGISFNFYIRISLLLISSSWQSLFDSLKPFLLQARDYKSQISRSDNY